MGCGSGARGRQHGSGGQRQTRSQDQPAARDDHDAGLTGAAGVAGEGFAGAAPPAAASAWVMAASKSLSETRPVPISLPLILKVGVPPMLSWVVHFSACYWIARLAF
jgi:hypothetical protein